MTQVYWKSILILSHGANPPYTPGDWIINRNSLFTTFLEGYIGDIAGPDKNRPYIFRYQSREWGTVIKDTIIDDFARAGLRFDLIARLHTHVRMNMGFPPHNSTGDLRCFEYVEFCLQFSDVEQLMLARLMVQL